MRWTKYLSSWESIVAARAVSGPAKGILSEQRERFSGSENRSSVGWYGQYTNMYVQLRTDVCR